MPAQIKLTVIPEDRVIIKNGAPLRFDFSADETVHAIQWHGTWGVIERKEGGTTYLSDFATVKPWSDAWDAEKARLDALPPVPQPNPVVSVTPWQIRKALNQIGMRSSVESFVASADMTTKDAWEFAQEFRRDNALISAAAQALGKTGAEIDALFALAKTL